MKACTRCGCGLTYNVPDMCLTCRYKVERDAALARAEKLESALRGFTEYFGAIADDEYPHSRPAPLRTMEQVLLDRARAALDGTAKAPQSEAPAEGEAP